MAKKEIVNALTGETKILDLTSEEEAQREIDIAKSKEEIETSLADIEARNNLKASAKAKLVAGEPLTQEEANTIVL